MNTSIMKKNKAIYVVEGVIKCECEGGGIIKVLFICL